MRPSEQEQRLETGFRSYPESSTSDASAESSSSSSGEGQAEIDYRHFPIANNVHQTLESPPISFFVGSTQTSSLDSAPRTGTSSESVIEGSSDLIEMAKLNIPDFWGKPEEDSIRYLKVLEFNFAPFRKAYSEESGISESEAKCLVLLGA